MRNFLKDWKFQPPKWTPKPPKPKYEHRLTIEFPTYGPIYAQVASEPKARLVIKALELLTINKPVVTYEKRILPLTDEGWHV